MPANKGEGKHCVHREESVLVARDSALGTRKAAGSMYIASVKSPAAAGRGAHAFGARAPAPLTASGK